MSKLPITVIVPTKNEAANIGKCLSSLAPAERVLVVDSKSTDETARLAKNLGAEVLQFEFRNRTQKKTCANGRWRIPALSPIGLCSSMRMKSCRRPSGTKSPK